MNHRRRHGVLGLTLPGLIVAAASVAQETRPIPEGLALPQGEVFFSSSATQAGLQGGGDLGAAAKQNSVLGDQATSFGFAAKSDEANVFLVGSLYSEALAFLRSGDIELAADRLEALEQQLIRLKVPNSLYGYATRIHNLVRQQRFSDEALLEMLSMFQPFFEDYARSRSEDFMILFRAGTWLVDLSLAAALGETDALRQEAHLNYLLEEMERMDAPAGVGEALNEIAEISAKDEITARDTQTIVDQVQRIQSILG